MSGSVCSEVEISADSVISAPQEGCLTDPTTTTGCSMRSSSESETVTNGIAEVAPPSANGPSVITPAVSARLHNDFAR